MSQGAPGLINLLRDNNILQRELAEGIGRSDAMVSKLLSGETGASQDTINAILAFLAARLGRPVTYEETFGAPTAVEPSEAVS